MCFPVDGAFRSGVNLSLCVCSEHCGSAVSLAKEQPWNCTSVVGVTSCRLHSLPSRAQGYYREGGSFGAQVGV